MNTTRYFEVKVTGCGTCPYSYDSDFGATGMDGWCGMHPRNQPHPKKLINDNYTQLTPSCPMWEQTKESETK